MWPNENSSECEQQVISQIKMLLSRCLGLNIPKIMIVEKWQPCSILGFNAVD